MLEAIVAIIMALLGLSADDATKQSPESYGAIYDQAKIIYYEQLEEKDGGAVSDNLAGSWLPKP